MIELLKNGSVVDTLAQTINRGGYNWDVNPDRAKGDFYQLRLTNLSNPEEIVEGEYFKIRSKSLIVPIIGGGVAVAGLTTYLLTREPEPEIITAPPNPVR